MANTERIANHYDGSRIAKAVEDISTSFTGTEYEQETPSGAMVGKIYNQSDANRLAGALETLSAELKPQKITDENETALPHRNTVKFINATVTDDAINDTTIVEIEGGGTTIVQKPEVTIGTYTYNGTEQGATISGLDTENTVVANAKNTNAGTYTLTISLKNTAKMVWNDMTTADLTYEYTIGKQSVSVPNVTGSFTYNGSSKTCTVATFDNNVISQAASSTTTATNAGTYYVYFDLRDTSNYKWTDGTTSQKSKSWVISKATPTITLNKTTATIDSDNPSTTVTVTKSLSGAGSIIATSDNGSVVTTSVSGNTVTIKSTDNNTSGTATVTIYSASNSNCNQSASKTVTVTANFEEYYLIHLEGGSQSDPAQKITYPSGSPNANYTAMSVNLSTGAPDYGSWATLKSDGSTFTKKPFFWPQSCELNHDGTVNAYLNEADNTKRLDGTASNYNNTSYDGEIMVEFPVSYITFTPDSGSDESGTIKISNKYSNGCICVRDANGKPAKWYAAKYTGSSSGMRSLSGLGNYVNNNSSTETTSARRLNKTSSIEWDKQTLVQWLIFNVYLMLVGKSTNTQTKFGYGRCASSNSSAINTGTMDKSGFFWGSSNQTSGVKCFGVENPWGNVWRRIHGLISVNGTVKYKLTKGTDDGSTATDYNDAGTNYLTLSGYTLGGTSGGYISKMVFTANGLFAVTASGSETTHYCDGLWFNNSQTNVAGVGGDWPDAGRVGAFCVGLIGAASYAGTGVAAALSCIPLAT